MAFWDKPHNPPEVIYGCEEPWEHHVELPHRYDFAVKPAPPPDAKTRSTGAVDYYRPPLRERLRKNGRPTFFTRFYWLDEHYKTHTVSNA